MQQEMDRDGLGRVPSPKRGDVVIRSVLFLQPVSGGHESIERFFHDEEVLQHAALKPGFLSAELHRPVREGDPSLVTALWESEAAYQSWVDDPWRIANTARGAEVFEPIESGAGGGSRYEVIIAVRRAGEASNRP